MIFSFGEYKSYIQITQNFPDINEITGNSVNALVIIDENTAEISKKILNGKKLPICLLKSGEENKNWDAVNTILKTAKDSGLGRDCFFIAVGGGVIGDLAGFAASIYMRGCRFILISTTLLGMVDASVGGKTGFDLFGIKNLAGTFYPAEKIFIPLKALSTLPQKEWKSGFAELIKTAILCGDKNDSFIEQLLKLEYGQEKGNFIKLQEQPQFFECIKKAVKYKGRIVTKDPRESGIRMLLNLGHTFGHALESSAGLGNITHGEAVAWGIANAVKLGKALGITPEKRAQKITQLIYKFGYDVSCPHPLIKDNNIELFLDALKSDKKKKQGQLTFIVPDKKNARIIRLDSGQEKTILLPILNGQTK
ncbi:MAG: 3-dehydroquinate synthase [Treponema sp.]|nr:3-dehydroquinate synthase [Treponema sp.]